VEALTRSGGWGLFLLYMIDANALLPPAIGYSVRRGNIPRNDNWQKPHLGGAGKSMFLTFEYSVMYVLSFATIITVFATAIALAVLLAMIACRSIWRLFREMAPELTGHGLPLSKCEAYNRVYDQFYQSR
jgi:hypothetical protein